MQLCVYVVHSIYILVWVADLCSLSGRRLFVCHLTYTVTEQDGEKYRQTNCTEGCTPDDKEKANTRKNTIIITLSPPVRKVKILLRKDWDADITFWFQYSLPVSFENRQAHVWKRSQANSSQRFLSFLGVQRYMLVQYYMLIFYS